MSSDKKIPTKSHKIELTLVNSNHPSLNSKSSFIIITISTHSLQIILKIDVN